MDFAAPGESSPSSCAPPVDGLLRPYEALVAEALAAFAVDPTYLIDMAKNARRLELGQPCMQSRSEAWRIFCQNADMVSTEPGSRSAKDRPRSTTTATVDRVDHPDSGTREDQVPARGGSGGEPQLGTRASEIGAAEVRDLRSP